MRGSSSDKQMVALFLSAVLIRSHQPRRLAEFYQRVFGLPFEASEHDEELHFECELADTHYAIFQAAPDEQFRANPITLAFAIDDMGGFVQKLQREGTNLNSGPSEHGFGTLASITDPDGNKVDVTQLSAGWLEYLRKRRTNL